MSPRDRDPYAEALARLASDLDRAEERSERARQDIVNLRVSTATQEASIADLLRRLGELESWRREESLTKGGVAWGAWRGVALSVTALAGLILSALSFARGC